MTEKNTPSTSDKNEESQTAVKVTNTDVKANTSGSSKKAKTSSTKSSPSATPVNKSSSRNMANPSKRSTTAILALLCSITALAGLGAGYVWHKQQTNALIDSLQKQSQQQIKATETQLVKLIEQQQSATLSNAERNAQQLAEQVAIASVKPVEQELAQLRAITDNLQQNNPTDWLAHEAEYLIRVASRAMWLEKDAQVSIDLLKDADLRIKELNNPELLPIRQLINQDIEMLNLLPVLATDEVILQLMALANQVNSLPIAFKYKPAPGETEPDFELSESTEDKVENLRKSLLNFASKVFTVKQRTAKVEALLTPNQQQNLRQNLQLKLQLAQWAATQHNAKLFVQALIESQNWLTEYFETDDARVNNFSQSLNSLKSKVIELTLPKKLDSLTAIRAFIKNDTKQATPVVKEEADEPQETQTEQPDKEVQLDDRGALL